MIVKMITDQPSPRAPGLWKKVGVDVEVFKPEGNPLENPQYWDALIVGAPYKTLAADWVGKDGLTKDAQEIGAVNLVVREPHVFRGYNTDVAGFRDALDDYFIPHDARTLVIGAGATGRAVLSVMRERVEKRWVWNRSHEKAQKAAIDFLANNAANYHPDELFSWFEVLVHTTPMIAYAGFPAMDLNVSRGGFGDHMAKNVHAHMMQVVLGGWSEEYKDALYR